MTCERGSHPGGMNLDSERITGELLRWRMEKSPGSYFLPRYTPTYWWECDLAEITKACYLREYEIKVSEADFKVDAKKSQNIGWHKQMIERYKLDVPVKQMGPNEHFNEVTKHDLLNANIPTGPSQFWFVMPWELALKLQDQIPKWGGLIGLEYDGGFRSLVTEMKKAPRLHRHKISDAHIAELQYRAYCRFIRQFKQSHDFLMGELANEWDAGLHG